MLAAAGPARQAQLVSTQEGGLLSQRTDPSSSSATQPLPPPQASTALAHDGINASLAVIAERLASWLSQSTLHLVSEEMPGHACCERK